MKIPVSQVVIVEGKYDKIKLDSILDADVITLDGFGIFQSDEKRSLIRRLAKTRGVIVLTDSDSAGRVIRNHIKSITGGEGVVDLYVPQIEGKEKRKESASKEGFLGVEGIDAKIIRELFEKYRTSDKKRCEVTRTRFFEDGYMGGEGSKERRERLAERLSLPRKISTTALLSAVNMLVTEEEYTKICEELK